MFGPWSNRKIEEAKPYSLPAPLPEWPKGQGFGTGIINLGELEVVMVKDFEFVATYTPKTGSSVSFYKPLSIPDGFFSFGHYAQPISSNQQLRRGSYVLVARNTTTTTTVPPLKSPLHYELIWFERGFFVWLPCPPEGYRALGFLVTTNQILDQVFPNVDAVMCVRHDLTEYCEVGDDILGNTLDFKVFNTKSPPCTFGGMFPKAVPVGTFFSTSDTCYPGDQRCLRNLNPNLDAMPNLVQIEALIDHYGPTVYFHPEEVYLPSSVPWFFNNGALLLKKDKSNWKNDGEFWLDINPEDDQVKHGDLKSAQLYVHVKPAFGGTFTDIDMWIFFPCNGPVTITFAKLLNMDVEIGQHVAGWEHFTLRLNNFDGELWSVYFSKHSGGGEWVETSNLEFIEGNKPIVYSAKGGHATFPKAGTHIKGWTKLGTGVKFEVDRSDWFIDASKKYQIIVAEYLGGVVAEPDWLQYMRDCGPTLMSDGRSELKKITSHLPFLIRLLAKRLIQLLTVELYSLLFE